GVDRVAERVEDRGDVEVDLAEMWPEIARGHDDVLGECAVALHPDADGVGAEGAPPGHAVPAAPAHDVTLRADDLAGVHRGHVLAELDHLAHELVPDDQAGLDRVLGPLVPGVDVQVRAADAGAEDADEHLTRPWLRFWYVLEPEAWFPLRLDQRLH